MVCLRYFECAEVRNDRTDKILPHDNHADRLPIGRILAQQQADGLERQLDERRRIRHRAHLDQVLFLDRFDGYAENVGGRR